MKYYNYNSETGELINGPIQAQVWPGREGLSDEEVKKWKLPASATWEVPPSFDANTETVIFANNEWSVVEDHRGTTVYIKENRVEVESWANTGPLPNTVTTIAPNGPYDRWYENLGTWVEVSSQKIAAYSAGVNIERNRRIVEGCNVVIANNSILIQGRQQDKDNLQGLVTAAQLRIAQGDYVTQTPFRDGRNDIYMLTPLQIITLWQAGASYVSACYQASWALKDLEDGPPADYANNVYWPAPQWPQP